MEIEPSALTGGAVALAGTLEVLSVWNGIPDFAMAFFPAIVVQLVTISEPM